MYFVVIVVKILFGVKKNVYIERYCPYMGSFFSAEFRGKLIIKCKFTLFRIYCIELKVLVVGNGLIIALPW